MLKRTISALLAALMLLGMVGCASGDGDGTEPVTQVQPSDATGPAGDGGATEPTGEDQAAPTEGEDVTGPSAEVTEPDVTEPGADVTEPDATEAVTEPTEAAPSESDVTEPVVTEPPATEPVSTEAAVTEPDPTEPAPTEPPATEPVATDPPATEAPATEPPATEHVHEYSSKVVAPTCTKKGYTKYTCDCGESYKDNYVDAAGHSYTSEVVAPTCEAEGYTLYTCECGDSYKDNFTAAGSHDYQAESVQEATMWQGGYTWYRCSRCRDRYKGDIVEKIPQEEFCRMVAEAALKYINQFRVEQGDTKAQSLPGLTLVAEYRAVQLIEKFEHNEAKLREAYAYYEYGEWIDGTLYGGTQQYYSADAKEAIGRRGSIGYLDGTADEIGCAFANGLRNSANHWAYVGSSDFTYIGIGVSCADGWWNICTLQTKDNYG